MTKNEKKEYKELLQKEQKRKEDIKKRNQKHREYMNKFNRETYTQIMFKLNSKKDVELIEFLKSMPNRTEWLRGVYNKRG